MGKNKKNLVAAKQVIDPETGEVIILETVARRPGEFVGVFEAKPKDEVEQKREQKYIKVKTAYF